ncbi:MAG: MATE family efflux transporter [Lachnospiraceae bacterium]|nr:MATE family efflux transporter [Lachnospiraceae bacterium]
MKLFQKDKPFYKEVFTLAIPIALQSLITIGVNMLDTKMVVSLSDNALSATSLANSFISIYHILCMGLGMGASVLISRYWGMKKAEDEPEKADHALKQTMSLMLRLTVILAAVFALATFLIPGKIIEMYVDVSKPEAPIIVELGEKYLNWSVLSYFFLGTSLTTTIALRSVGQVKLPLFVSIGAFFVNLIANYMLIFGNWGAPRMEIEGAALATLIARIFEATVIVGYLLIKDKKIGFRLKHLFLSTRSLVKEYFRICIPVLISDGLLALGNNAVTMVIGHLGGAYTAANAIASVTQQLTSVVITGVSQAGAIVTGRTLGFGDREKTMRNGWAFLGLGLALGAFSGLLIMIIKSPIVYAYEVTGDTEAVTRQLLNAISVIIVFQATNSIMTKGVLRGGGDTKMLMLTDNVFLFVLSLPLGMLAGYVLELDAFWIFICLKMDQIVKTIWCVFRLKSEKWIKKISTGAGK